MMMTRWHWSGFLLAAVLLMMGLWAAEMVLADCPFGCKTNVKYVCKANGYWEFTGVGPALEINDPQATGALTGSLVRKQYGIYATQACDCTFPECVVPCQTANQFYSGQWLSDYFYMECDVTPSYGDP